MKLIKLRKKDKPSKKLLINKEEELSNLEKDINFKNSELSNQQSILSEEKNKLIKDVRSAKVQAKKARDQSVKD